MPINIIKNKLISILFLSFIFNTINAETSNSLETVPKLLAWNHHNQPQSDKKFDYKFEDNQKYNSKHTKPKSTTYKFGDENQKYNHPYRFEKNTNNDRYQYGQKSNPYKFERQSNNHNKTNNYKFENNKKTREPWLKGNGERPWGKQQEQKNWYKFKDKKNNFKDWTRDKEMINRPWGKVD
ncbi:MAG: hypothetical protein HON94_09295 [Methylococcales bacterium]|nr:hypothetical protein [Methylococcales bacterium]MBT7409142.1 hypothetical protein [Methylococcales bacterium]